MKKAFLAAILLAMAAAYPASPLSAQGEAHWTLLTASVPANRAEAIRVQLVDGGGRPVASRPAGETVRVDMSPDNMAGMTAPAKISAAGEPGLFLVVTNLTAPGRWAIILSAAIDGKTIKGSLVVLATQKSANAQSARRVAYYRNAMTPGEISPVSRKDAMGMDYIPVYADELTKPPGTIRLSAGKMRNAGLATTQVVSMKLAGSVRASGTVAADENRQAVVTARFNGFIEKLFVSQTGDTVRVGQNLMQVWIESPEVLNKEADYIGSLQSHSDIYAALAANVLRQFGIPQSALDEMARRGAPSRIITVTVPMSGTVVQKNAMNGMRFAAGDPLYRITDLSHLWILASVPERDLASLRAGQSARITFRDDVSASFDGKVLFIYPELDAATRTGMVRIALANGANRLRIGQYADVEIDTPVLAASVLAVPASAIVDGGAAQIAFVAGRDGSFEARKLKLGARTRGMVEVLSGLQAGEHVVTAANFLIDAESNLQTALQSFAPGPRP